MKIQVKRTHIQRGRQGKTDSCPIALSIKESLGAKSVQVEADTVTIGKRTFDLPDEAVRFIDFFDDCKDSVEPFEFEL